MFDLVFSCLVISAVLINTSTTEAYPFEDDLDQPITYKTISSLRSHRADGEYRLSGDAVPVHYQVLLQSKLHLKDFTFSGDVTITFDAIKDADHVTLHMYESKVWEATLRDLQTNTSFILYDQLDEIKDLVTFRGVSIEGLRIIGGHQYELQIKYEGELRNDNAGFYLSSYQNNNGDNVNMATTQFEATSARHAFPCFDEPAYKATFDIAITHGIDYVALSNMPVLRTENTTSTTRTTHFQTTPKMSTYLVAFIISDFVSSANQQGSVMHRVYSRSDTKNEQSYGLQTSQKALEHLSNYLDVPYNLSKLDNVAIPDFGSGAMENWGLVTYREEYLLYSPQKSTVNTQLNVAIMISHELVHQWFGDLVTPKWWQYLWLNEGFATLYEYLTVNAIYPKYGVMENFAVAHFQRALAADAINTPRAMSTYVETPEEISMVFDSVTYSKCESIFQKGLSSYLKAYSYDAVDENHLFQHLINAVGSTTIPGLPTSNMDLFFKSWTNQGGYPLLTVTRNYVTGDFGIMQELFDGTNKSNSIVMFVVPFNYVYGNNPNFTDTSPQEFLNKVPSMTVSNTSNENSDTWLLLNKQLTGYYRVNYDQNNWERLVQQLLKDHIAIYVTNRAQLIDDTMALALAGRVDHSLPLALLEYLVKEEHYAPWAAASNALSTLNTYLLGGDKYDLFEYYIRQLVSPFYKKVGVSEGPSDTMHQKLTRNIAINWACRGLSESCVLDTNKRLNEIIDSGKDVEPSLKAAIFCNGLIKGGEKEFMYIFRRILSSKDQAERRQLMPALGCSTNETLLMEFAMTSTTYSSEINYRATERVNVLPAIIDKNIVGLRAGIKFLINKHVDYYNLGATGFMDSNPLLSIMSRIAVRIYSEELSQEFETLIAAVKTGPAANAPQLDAMRTRIRTNIGWTEENRPKYVKWLNEYRNSANMSILSTLLLVVTVSISFRGYV